MQDELLFGTAYYPEYMPYDRIDTDFKMMKQAGMNVVRIAESTWSTLEPVEDTFDFTYIDQVLARAEAYDMQVIIGTPTYAIPAWLVQKDPQVMVTTVDGQESYGHRQLMDIANATYRSRAEIVIRKLLEHTAAHPCVIGFQIDNETKHYGTASRQVQQQFVRYLQDKFHTTEALNRAFHLNYWSNAVHRWEDFPDMRGCCNGGLAGEFAAFQRKLAADFLLWQANLVREYKREDQFITHNFDFEWKKFGADIAQDGYSYGVQPDINHYEAAQCLTIAGTDIYHPTQDDLTGAEIAFGGDEIRSLKNDNYLVLECQAQAFKYWTPYPGQLRLHAYSHLASGAQGILYWNWHSIHNGYEAYWRGLLSHDLLSNPAYEEACRIGEEWAMYGGSLSIRKENQVALVVDNLSLNALKWFPVDKDLSYNDIVRWMYDALYEMNIACDVVDIHGLDVDKYKMIVTPALYCISEEHIARLREFVRNGGVLVSSFKSFVADEQCTIYPDQQPHRLHECFGMSYNQFTHPGRMQLYGKPVEYFAELLKVTIAESLADYQHKYWGQYSGIVKNAYGEGYGYYIGCYTDASILKDIYRKAVQDAGIWDEAMVCQWPIIIRSGVNAYGKKLHYIFNYSEDEVAIPMPYEGREILTDRYCSREEKTILKDWDVVIIEEDIPC